MASSAASTSSPSASASTADTCPEENQMFVRHRLTKQDNLAGLAVKYNVTVSDIKRANGFLSDSAMFAKDTLLIPTRPMLISPEYSAWAGMIVAHYGRLPQGRVQSNMKATSAAALSELRGYYSTGPSLDGSASFSDEEDELGAGVAGRRDRQRWQRQGEVELMTRPQSFQPAASYADDRLRRRNYGADGEGEQSEGLASFAPPSSPPSLRASLFRSATDSRGRVLQMGAGLPDLRDLQRRGARWRDQVLSKLKKAASQPVLSASMLPSMGQAADAANAVARPASAAGASASQQLVYSATTPQRPKHSKQGSKAD